MAFCNSCGASIAPGTSFCNKCGTAILSSSPSVPPAVPPASGSALKAVLIIVGVVVLVGILGVTALAFFAVRMAHRTRVRHEGDNVKVETPFGTVQTTKDPQEAARNLGVDIYPGAQILQQGAVSATMGGVHSASLNFETSDSVDQVCSFYKPRFPNAMVMSRDANQCTIVSNDQKNMITINAKTENSKTRIVITNVSKSGVANSSSN